ncbi:MAG: hypothetical protein K8R54_15790 [Bacteroidales bacterium]|nr:hypothetical protein [Bacteroidales bacterium]
MRTISIIILALMSFSSPAQRIGYVKLFKDDTWRGRSLTVDIKYGIKIYNIDRGNPVHDEASSVIIGVPIGYTVQLCNHHSTDGRFPGNMYSMKSTGQVIYLNKDTFKRYGIHDEISSVRIFSSNKRFHGIVWVGRQTQIYHNPISPSVR